MIPYRNREEHLKYFINNTAPFLNKHLTNLNIVIIEQSNTKLFNRGILLNIGFNENINLTDCTYFTHDVDVNPYEQTIIDLYTAKIDTNTINGIYTSQCGTLGGVICFKKESFFKINGFPNNFYGWGVEDMVLLNRAIFHKINITKNVLSGSQDAIEKFKIFNDNHDRSNEELTQKTDFEYDKYKYLSNDEKILHNAKLGGINNLKYIILKTETINDYIKLIKVDF